jgi:hypothetical protein
MEQNPMEYSEIAAAILAAAAFERYEKGITEGPLAPS